MLRQKEFRKNQKLEQLLKEINDILQLVEDKILENFVMPRYPVILVIGAPRCGTTLTMQWLASTEQIAYPTNILSRFYNAPYIGAKIQLLLTSPEYNFKDEIIDFNKKINFTSTLGKTKGILSPNEFFYFWRRFITNDVPKHLSENELQKFDVKKIAAEIAAIEAVFDKPFATKGAFLQYNIPALSSLFTRVLFIYVKRYPFYNIQSLLEAREKYYGNKKIWYSVKPKEYYNLKNQDIFTQVAGQVYYTNLAIENGINHIDSIQSLIISYEKFCEYPQYYYYQIVNKLAEQECEIDHTYIGPKKFENTNQVRVTPEECKKILEAYRDLTGEELEV